MGFFSRLFSKEPEPEQSEGQSAVATQAITSQNEYERLQLDRTMTTEEYDLVSVIASSICAGDNPSSTIRIRNITAIDMDKMAAVLAVSGAISGDSGHENSVYRLSCVSEITAS